MLIVFEGVKGFLRNTVAEDWAAQIRHIRLKFGQVYVRECLPESLSRIWSQVGDMRQQLVPRATVTVEMGASALPPPRYAGDAIDAHVPCIALRLPVGGPRQLCEVARGAVLAEMQRLLEIGNIKSNASLERTVARRLRELYQEICMR